MSNSRSARANTVKIFGVTIPGPLRRMARRFLNDAQIEQILYRRRQIETPMLRLRTRRAADLDACGTPSRNRQVFVCPRIHAPLRNALCLAATYRPTAPGDRCRGHRFLARLRNDRRRPVPEDVERLLPQRRNRRR